MSRKLGYRSSESPVMIEQALRFLRAARDILRREGCEQALNRVRFAIVSAEGAKRHAERVVSERHAPIKLEKVDEDGG